MAMLKAVRTEAPDGYPVTLEEAKAHVKVETDDEDDLILLYIAAATARLEGPNGFTERAFLTQTWTQSFGAFPSCDRLRLLVGPVQSIESIDYYDINGDPIVLDEATYALFQDGDGSFAKYLTATTWPSTSSREDAATITYVAGFGDTPEDVPSNIRQAILLVVGHFYENREATAGAAMSGLSFELPLSVNWLLHEYRRYAR